MVKRNVGGLDRRLRGLFGAALLALAVGAGLTGRRGGPLAAIAGVGLLANWATGFCTVNALLGIDTCPAEER